MPPPDAQLPPLMPWPSRIEPGVGAVPIDTDFSVALSGAGAHDPRVVAAASRLLTRLARQTGIPITPKSTPASEARLVIAVEGGSSRATQKLGDNETYSLIAAARQITISAHGPLGALRGTETFLQLVQPSPAVPWPAFAVSAVTIHDEPRFPWRGFSLDVARHFMPLDVVRRTVDGLAAVKLNVLHWHLSDDEGFRVESKRYPRLQQYGSDGLYYTQAEIRGVIAYARDRGVRIVPEFDMPGHVTSWLPGYPQLGSRSGSFAINRGYDNPTDLMDPTKESTYRFLDGFIGEMAELFPDQYFHVGGDEVNPKQWNDNPRIREFMLSHHLADAKALHTYFNRRLLAIVTSHGKRMEGWDEILEPGLPKSVVVESWRGQPSLWKGASEGFAGILAAGYYLDLMYPASYHYSIDPLKAPSPAPGPGGEAEAPEAGQPPPGTPATLTPDQAKLILGGEAAMWSELATPENIDAKLWPRLAAIAERFWSPESVTDVPSMYRRLAATDTWLGWLGLTQHSNLQLMRARLAAPLPPASLDKVASVLEPVKGYSRNAEKYSNAVPLNRLVDAISPESDAARQFGEAVDAYLAAPQGERKSDALRLTLQSWSSASEEMRRMCALNSALAGDLPVADALTHLSSSGLEALSYLDRSAPPPSDWKARSTSAVASYVHKNLGDILIPVAPAIARLVEAVP